MRPLSQIIYVGNNLSTGYKNALQKIGRDLNIEVEICLGGVNSKKFQSAWTNQLRQYENQQKKILKGDNDEDDNNDEDEDENEGHSRISNNLKSSSVFLSHGPSPSDKNEKCERDDSCASFLKKMISVNTAKRSKRGSQGEHDVSRRSTTTTTTPSVSARLQRRPQVQGPMNRYLTLKDPSVLNTRNFALSKRVSFQTGETDDGRRTRKSLKGGAVLTRAATRKKLEVREDDRPPSSRSHQSLSSRAKRGNTLVKTRRGMAAASFDHPNERVEKLQKSGTSIERKEGREARVIGRRKRRLEETSPSSTVEERKVEERRRDKTNEVDDVHEEDDLNLEEKERQERDEKDDGNEGEMQFKPDCLLLLDDLFVSSVNEYTRGEEGEKGSSNSNGKNRLTFDRREKENISRAMNIACRLVVKLSHHWQINTIITHQGTLNSSGSNFISRGMRILRNNMDAFIRM